MMNKRSLVLEAAQAAADAREQAGVDDIAPIDIYGVAARLGVKVRFVDISMEGIYKKGPPSMMLLSSLRPLARRAFTCGHEAGHHYFGHGSTVDQLQGDDRQTSENPEEILADAFSAFLLMPTIGLRRAFAVRKWKIEAATPLQIATISNEFGVGYTTLISHLSYVLHQLPADQKVSLLRYTPQRIRDELLGGKQVSALTIIDRHSQNEVIDLEIGQGLALPTLSDVGGQRLERVHDYGHFDLFRAVSRGSEKVRVGMREMTIRVGPVEYVGKAEFRHLEDPDE